MMASESELRRSAITISPTAAFRSGSTALTFRRPYNVERIQRDIRHDSGVLPEAIAKYIDFRAFDVERRQDTFREDIHPRTALVNELQRRLGKPKPEILLIHGPAGTGKTTAMHLLSEGLGQTPNQAQATFFYGNAAPGTPEEGRAQGIAKEKFVLTLLHQLRTNFSPSLPFPVDHLPGALSVFPIERQISNWIITPMLAARDHGTFCSASHCAILIDGLENLAKTHAEQQEILDALRELVTKLYPLFSVVVSTRAATSTFVPANLRHLPEELEFPITSIALSETIDADADIAHYYKSELPALKMTSMQDVLGFLVGFTAGNFALATGFVDHFRHGEGRYQPFPASNDIARRKASGFHGLDKLYEAAFSSIPADSAPVVRAIVGRVLCSPEPQTPADIRLAFGAQFTFEHIKDLLRPLEGIISVAARQQPIRPCHHHTLSAFLFDQTRSGTHHIPQSTESNTFGMSPDPSLRASLSKAISQVDRDTTSRSRKWRLCVHNRSGGEESVEFTEKLRRALPSDMEPWMVEFTISLELLPSMTLNVWKPEPKVTITPEGRRVEEKVQLGDIIVMKRTGEAHVLFNAFTSSPDDPLTPPGFQPLPRRREIHQELYKREYYRQRGSGKFEGEIEFKHPGGLKGLLPKTLVCDVTGNAVGWATVHHNGHRKEELHEDDREDLLRYLEESASTWDVDELRQQIPAGAGLFCVLSALYTDLWSSVAFFGRKRSSNFVSQMEPDPDQPAFRSWTTSPSDFHVRESTYHTNPVALPAPRTKMNACVGLKVAILTFSPTRTKKLGIGRLSSSGRLKTIGQTSGYAPSGNTSSRSNIVPKWLTRGEKR